MIDIRRKDILTARVKKAHLEVQNVSEDGSQIECRNFSERYLIEPSEVEEVFRSYTEEGTNEVYDRQIYDRQTDGATSLLKSLGLYKRTLRDSLPEQHEECLWWRGDTFRGLCKFRQSSYGHDDLHWYHEELEIETYAELDDRWLPLKALEQLP